MTLRWVFLVAVAFAGCGACDTSSGSRAKCAATSIETCDTEPGCVLSRVRPAEELDALERCIPEADCEAVDTWVRLDDGRCAYVLSECVDGSLEPAPDCAPVDCSLLNEQQCAEYPDCRGITAERLTDEQCTVDEFASCIHVDQNCSNGLGFVKAPDGTCWKFLGGCRPEKWGSEQNDPECMEAFEVASACE